MCVCVCCAVCRSLVCESSPKKGQTSLPLVFKGGRWREERIVARTGSGACACAPRGAGLGACGACEKGRGKEGEERLKREETREDLEEQAARAGQSWVRVCVAERQFATTAKRTKGEVAKGRFKGTRWSSGYVCVQKCIYSKRGNNTRHTLKKRALRGGFEGRNEGRSLDATKKQI